MDQGTTIRSFFLEDHRRCDAVWAKVEAAADAKDTATAASAWREFDTAMRHHLDMEEQVLFPAFEEATGMSGGGPTAVMRSEHQQMRALLDQMGEAAGRDDFQTVVDHGDTLLMLIQQHNSKEEGMLYPMAEQALAGRWPELAAAIEQLDQAS